MSIFLKIAVDGPSASGKGTIARRLASQFHLSYLDTGALYRVVAKHILENGGNPDNPEDALKSALFIRDHFSWNMLEDPGIRNDVVADATSRSSQIPVLREALKAFQKDFAAHPPHKPHLKPWEGSILDGRDIGTSICPDADVKLYITASTEVRAQRRTKELNGKGIPSSYETVLQDMTERDARDKSRTTNPLRPADDAVILDTSNMTIDEVFEKACSVIRKKLA
ncbi:MAG: (d)CMP kinase [Pseudobdellovibrionaceae bacterium]|jgi:cytidylate kinase|nr:(d)CMP kinase [Pseudobdellovibrionaceae bacterium]